MGVFVIYVIEWSLCLSAFLLLYKMCFSGCTFHRFNRFFLLGSVVVSAFLPLIHINMGEQMEPVAEVCRLNIDQLESQVVISQTQTQLSEPKELMTTMQKMFVFIAVIYLLYVVTQIVNWMRSLIKMMRLLHGCRIKRMGRWIRLAEHGDDYGPFCWMNFIVVSEKESGFSRRTSLRHELSHIKLLHPIDLLFILLCTLINPISWIVMKEIKVVHEYEADNKVISHYRIRHRDYQLLLLRRTVGAEAYALACSFNINFKKRIKMMKKKQSTWWRLAWIAITIPMIFMSLLAFSKPKEVLREAVDSSVKIIGQPLSNFFGTDADSDVSSVASEEYVATNGDEIECNDIVEKQCNGIEENEIQETQLSTTETANEIKHSDQISGRVVDDKGCPVTMAAVIEQDEYGRIFAAVMTDKNGLFTLKIVNPEHKIRITCVGYISQSIDLCDENINVVLIPNTTLTDVTVISNVVSIDTEEPRYNDVNKAENKSDNAFEIEQKMPAFPDGNQGLVNYMNSHVRYPAIAREMQVEANVIVEFTVDKTGLVRSPRVADIKASSPLIIDDIQKSANEGNEEALETMRIYEDAIEAIKEEAVYVIRNMPRWEPCRRNGIRFAMDMKIPIEFKMVRQ